MALAQRGRWALARRLGVGVGVGVGGGLRTHAAGLGGAAPVRALVHDGKVGTSRAIRVAAFTPIVACARPHKPAKTPARLYEITRQTNRSPGRAARNAHALGSARAPHRGIQWLCAELCEHANKTEQKGRGIAAKVSRSAAGFAGASTTDIDNARYKSIKPP